MIFDMNVRLFDPYSNFDKTKDRNLRTNLLYFQQYVSNIGKKKLKKLSDAIISWKLKQELGGCEKKSVFYFYLLHLRLISSLELFFKRVAYPYSILDQSYSQLITHFTNMKCFDAAILLGLYLCAGLVAGEHI